ncbi:MAG: RibD family protein, partial [Phycisphaerae bacterium]|nr:RibD family protein [Phycisphaerae bacterium]
GVCASEAAALNAPFAKLIKQGRPWVILKWAQSLDGKIATRTGDAKWITDEQSREHAHRVRGRVDAIVVGLETVRRDDPMLTGRVGRATRVATRIILDPELQTPMRAKLVTTASDIPTLIFCGADAPASREKRLTGAGCAIERVRGGAKGLSLPTVLDRLGKRQFTNILVEGGGETLGHFFDQGLADEVHVYVAPVLIGGRDAVSPLHATGVRRIADAIRLDTTIRARRLGNGWFAQARL